MAEREVMPRLPTSGQIIGALVTKLDIKHPLLRSRTARRYFSGDAEHLVKDATRENIIGAIAEVLTESGFIKSPQAGEDDYQLAAALASMLKWHADNWDLQRSFLRRRMTKVLPSNLPKVWGAFVRLAVIDLSLRVAAHTASFPDRRQRRWICSTGQAARPEEIFSTGSASMHPSRWRTSVRWWVWTTTPWTPGCTTGHGLLTTTSRN